MILKECCRGYGSIKTLALRLFAAIVAGFWHMPCVFNFNLAIPLNYLLQSFGGKVIIVQGLKDPLIKSKLKVSMFREYCNGIVIGELNAGGAEPLKDWIDLPLDATLSTLTWYKTYFDAPRESILFHLISKAWERGRGLG
ncbi:hypothetical protein NE237_030406 [Protea cynaroides]|uniref:Uncharacterized protein n=1 Tax=Protea cynaroides TaxID=273540 RepID=A0A9Q0GXS6_9MAGN|nr:hypothetical protein NE237_030406 [Protea cynaroides]